MQTLQIMKTNVVLSPDILYYSHEWCNTNNSGISPIKDRDYVNYKELVAASQATQEINETTFASNIL